VTELLEQVPAWVWLLVDALAVYRATRLVTRDSLPLFAVPRDAVARRWDGRALAYFVECPWCVGQWVAFIAVAGRVLVPLWWTPLALALAYSAVTGWLAERE
jgi:hypothetical protein